MANSGFSGGGGGDRFYESNLGKDAVQVFSSKAAL